MAITAGFMVHGAICGSFSSRIPWIAGHLRLSSGSIGLALLMATAGSLATMPMTGRLAHRLGARATMRLLLAMFCAVLVLPALAPNLPCLCACMAAFGALTGMCDVVMNAEAIGFSERLGRPIVSGLHGMWSVGGLIGGAAGVLAAESGVGAPGNLAVVAAALLAVSAFAGQWLPRAERGGPGVVEPPRFALPSRLILFVGIVGFCSEFCEAAGQNWSAVYLRQTTGASAGVAAASYTAFAFCMAGGRLCGDMAVRKIGSVWCVRVSGVLAAAGGLQIVFATSPLMAIAGFMGLGLGVAAVLPLAFVAAAGAARTRSEGVAGVATVAYTADFLAPAAIGLIAAFTSLAAAFALVTVLGASMMVTAAALRSRREAVADLATERAPAADRG